MSHDSHVSHVLPWQILVAVFGALIVLTGATVAAILVDLGPTMNLVVAMGIATIKAALVVLFFMHLFYDNKLYLTIFLGSVVFLFLFISFTLLDSMQTQRAIEDKIAADEAAAAVQGG